MKKLQRYYAEYHPIVWVLLAGTVLARGASFMTLPFLAIYLSRNLELHPLLIGLTIGISPLMATAGGFLGGYLSDRIGRKPVMIGALFTWVLVFFGFLQAEAPAVFILLNALNGLCSSFFEPTSQALIADLTPKEKRMRVFSLRYTAINVGASVGPLLGAYLALSSAKTAFLITGTVYLIYSVVLFLLMNRFSITAKPDAGDRVTFSGTVRMISRDKALGFLILGSILINIGYTQIESNLPQHLTMTIENAVFVYSVLLSLNAILVVFLQMPISRFAERYPAMQVMMAGSVFLSAGLIGFGLVHGWVLAIVSMILVTIGEILIFPSSSYLVDQLAVDHLRGTYFGAAQFRKIGHFIGPVFGGYLLGETGGMTLFATMAAVVLFSIVFFLMGSRVVAGIPATVKK